MYYLLILIGTILAFWVSAICGGGASLVLIPMLNWVLKSTEVPAALTVGTFSSSVSRIAVFRKHIHWKIVRLFVPAAIPTVWLGAYLLKYLNPIYLQFFIAVFLLINVKQLIAPGKKVRENETADPGYILVIIGAIAGFVSGLTGAVGLLFNRFYLKYGLSKESIVATRAANDVILHTIKLLLYWQLGLFSQNALITGLLLAAGAMVSAVTVKKILPLISEVLFRKIGYGAMALSGVILLVSTSQSIIAKDHPTVHFSPFSESVETQLSWRKSAFSLEMEYDEGFVIEQQIPYEEIPVAIQAKIDPLIENADEVTYEKTFSLDGRSYEAYVIRNGQLKKYDFTVKEDDDE